MLIYLIFAVLLGFLGLCIALPLVRYLEKNPQVPAAVLLAVISLDVALPIPPIMLGSLSVYIMDLVASALLVLAFPFYYGRLKEGVSVADLPMLCFLLWSFLLGLNYVLGVREFGIQAATVEFRGYLYFISVGLYFASLKGFAIWPMVEKLWLFFTIPLLIAAVAGYADGDLSRVGRPLGAYPTFYLLEALLIGICLFRRGALPRIYFPVCAALFPLLILLQHRSVWVVGLFSFGFLYWLMPSARAVLLKWGSIGVVAFGCLAVGIFGEQIFEAISESYREAVSSGRQDSTSTLVWRFQGWVGLLTGEQTNTATQVLVGNSFGTGWERVTVTSGVEQEVKVSPHNFYLQTFLRSGLLGLGALLGLYYMLVRKLYILRMAPPDREIMTKCVLLLLLSQTVFYMAYGGAAFCAIAIGVGIGMYRDAHRSSQSNVEPA